MCLRRLWKSKNECCWNNTQENASHIIYLSSNSSITRLELSKLKECTSALSRRHEQYSRVPMAQTGSKLLKMQYRLPSSSSRKLAVLQ